MELSSLNPQQRQAVKATDGPVLILAGAGTGKTRVITSRVAYMIAKGIQPGNILAVTFTNKAAREMQERIRELVPKAKLVNSDGKTEKPTICTFHSLCVRILRRHIEKLGYKKNFVIYDETEQLGVVRRLLSHISDKSKKPDPYAILSLISRWRNSSTDTLKTDDPDMAALAKRLVSDYRQTLKASNAVDFDDLILLVLQLFGEHPAALEECRARYRYIMVDEYQDTNGSQFDLVHSLAKEHRNFCVVGDDDQSIYGWRGAEVANLLELEIYFPEVLVVKLEQNYRSTNAILNAANAVIKNNADRREKRLWSDKGRGDPITLWEFRDDEEEAQAIVEELNYNRRIKKVKWRDQAILFRTNQQSRPLETALRKADIRYNLVGGQSFFDRKEIRDFVSYLKLFLNPDDDTGLLRIANVPSRGLSNATMEKLLQLSQERRSSVFAVMQDKEALGEFRTRTIDAILDFVELIDIYHNRLMQPVVAHPENPLKAWCTAWLAEVGLFQEIRRIEKNEESAENKVRNIVDLLETMDPEFVPTDRPIDERLHRYLEHISLDRDKDDTEEARDVVTLITMHSCKGLEFPHVYIAGVEDGLIPHSRSKVEGTLDEERRLFYVAITRAQASLSMSHCEHRKKYGEQIPCHPSPFLKEIPEELIIHGNEAASEPASEEEGLDFFANLKASLEE
ncbi:MAG: UvrD-helicase domain-containing protein [Verrucomicrobiales bacterium]|nr:UvrD-helicase domain-containing protein [Verrucomicrobiales bacterium]